MVKVSLDQIKSLREETGVGIMEAKRALTEAKGNFAKAKSLLLVWGAEKLAKREDKETKEGQVFAYVHNGGRIGAMIAVACETDFTAASAEFQQLGRELAMQVASMEPKNLKELLAQSYIRDPKTTISDQITAVAAKVKEKIAITAFERFSL